MSILCSRVHCSFSKSRLTVLAIAVVMMASHAMTTDIAADAGWGFYGYRAYRPVLAPRVAYRPRVVVAPPVAYAPRVAYRASYRAVVPAPYYAPAPVVAPPVVAPVARYGSYYGGYGVSVSPFGVSVGYDVAPVSYYHY